MPVVEAFSDTRSYSNTNMLVVASRRLWSGVSSAIPFLFLDLTYFMVENAPSYKYVLKIEEIFDDWKKHDHGFGKLSLPKGILWQSRIWQYDIIRE